MNIRTINKSEKEYTKLEFVAKALQIVSPNNIKYQVEDVYFDLGQDWMWTTIVSYGSWECQILNPREWENIMLADDLQDLLTIVENIRNGKYFGDK